MTSLQTRTEKPPARDTQSLDHAFLGSLLPGIIHNWATPLSGVIGAAQLLEKRACAIEELVRGHAELTAAECAELSKQLERNRTNVEILSRNAQHLADLLQVLVYRITRSSGVSRDVFPLNELVQNELRFLEANLQFKHKVKKQITLSPTIPATAFSYGFVAAAIDELVTQAVSRHDPAHGVLEMEFTTGTQNGDAYLRIEVCTSSDIDETEGSDSEAMETYLNRLREDGWTVDYGCRGCTLRLFLRRPRRETAA